jgi:hypothetical protein
MCRRARAAKKRSRTRVTQFASTWPLSRISTDSGEWGAYSAICSDAEALEYILLAFNNVRNPSHNRWAWDNCRNVGINWLRN